jgi:hypothetical protein
MKLCLDFVLERLGSTRVVAVRNYDLPLADALSSMGIEPNADALFEVSLSRTVESLTELLSKDMVYGCEMMPRATAEEYAKDFFVPLSGDGTRFFTNGDWDRYHQHSSFGYMPLTNATFSAVVMVVHPKYAVCVVVEDED